MRPALIFKAAAASEIRRLFVGQVPPALIRRSLVPVVPDMPGLRVQVVHSLDVGDAYARAVINGDARGAFNLAAEPVLGPAELAAVFGARRVSVSPRVARAAAALAFRLHISPVEEGWLDMGLQVPLMDSGRARRELGWSPSHEARETLAELVDGMARSAGLDTPPLARSFTASTAG
jgi:nucleoside-diphosphate-sugar epimerase